MLKLGVLPLVLHRPRTVFEELKGETDIRDGLTVWLTTTLCALLLYAALARRVGINFIPIPFGIGPSIAFSKIIVGIFAGLASFVLIGYVADVVAVRLGGTGTLSETIGFLGYTQMLAILQSLGSILALIVVVTRVGLITQMTAVQGELISPAEVYGPLGLMMYVMSIAFLLWSYWLTGTAISVAHNISFWRGLAATVVAFIIVTAIFSQGLGLLL